MDSNSILLHFSKVSSQLVDRTRLKGVMEPLTSKPLGLVFQLGNDALKLVKTGEGVLNIFAVSLIGKK